MLICPFSLTTQRPEKQNKINHKSINRRQKIEFPYLWSHKFEEMSLHENGQKITNIKTSRVIGYLAVKIFLVC